MKKIFFLLLLTVGFVQAMMPATDIVQLKKNCVPILLERSDNMVCFLRIEADKCTALNEVSLTLGDDVDLKDIRAIRLYYGGTEAVQNENQIRYAPVSYIARDKAGETRDANLSYSIKIAEVAFSQNTENGFLPNESVRTSRNIILKTNQPLLKGINYFWISIQMKPDASLLSKITFDVDQVLLDNESVSIVSDKDESYCFRMGTGVRHAGDDGSASYRIPGLVTTNDGTLLGVYDVRYNNSADLQEHVDIGLSRSTDKGQTWEPMRIAMSFGEYAGLPRAQNGVGDPAILVDRQTGTIWVIAVWTHGMGNGRAWFNSQQGMNKEQTAQLMLVRSDDDGQTWSEPINITDQVKDPSWYFLLQGPGMGITMQDGTLVFAAQYIDKEKVPNACLIYSKDRGKTWHLHNHARSNTTEAQVAEVEPGVLMLNMRDNRGGSRAVSITRDLGKTWEEHPSSRSVLQEPVCMASLIKSGAKDNILGKDILLFSNPNTIKGRNHITIKASLDGGLTFPGEYQLMLDEGDGWGYSCLTMIDKETVGILYEGSTAHMVFQAIKLKDIVK